MRDTLAPPDELIDGPFKFVVGMPEYTAGTTRRVETPLRIRDSWWRPSLVVRVRRSGDKERAWSVHTKYDGGYLDEDVVCQMLNPTHTTRVLVSWNRTRILRNELLQFSGDDALDVDERGINRVDAALP